MSYLTVTEADTYFEGRMFAEAWTDSTTDDKTKALTHATSILNRLRYKGTKTDPNQTDQFPRDLTNDLVPQDVKDATAEIALAMLDGIDPQMEIEDLSVTAHSYAQTRSTYNRDFARLSIAAGVPSATAWSMIRRYLANPSEVKISRVS